MRESNNFVKKEFFKAFDSHAHPLTYTKRDYDFLDLGIENQYSQIDYIKMKHGGVEAVIFALPVVFDLNTNNIPEMLIMDIRLVKEKIGQYPQLAEIVHSINDLEKVTSQGKLAIFLSIEYPHFVDNRLDYLEKYKKLGIVSIAIGDDTVCCENEMEGLNEFSKKLIQKMNALGLIIDISHSSNKVKIEVIKESSHPVIASHSNARALCDNPRNIPDETLKMIADQGGVIMVTFFPGLVDKEFFIEDMKAWEKYGKKEMELKNKYKENSSKINEELEQYWEKIKPTKIVDFVKVIDHIDYIVNLVGIDHVGIGSDFSGAQTLHGLEDAAQFQNIA
ncbi:MAG: hypothetical protein FK731_12110, partial [Asgard group archaeon]|nr:hypothetical protein [Asgard group archaeon]